jgi:predicted flap endonuclease-1-like 5' DNA nuclease
MIEGIGPKVQQILYENDILTYESLSRLTAGHISNIISPYGTTYESMNPVTWPKQAQLAAANKREELETLKQELKK